MKIMLKDDSPMPFGKYKGKPMSEIPAAYFHWLWTEGGMENNRVDDVAIYIRENLAVLESEYQNGVW